ncbi:MarR family winged helix-turn-helix transcriptional regulator [Chryseobacterium arachidis]|uniref:MarR family winged helix-turn-helix transcriptional regulator n=1 Tax=Chryseobacterium arachidis TaxID=1416778 RepID=UPI00360A2C16
MKDILDLVGDFEAVNINKRYSDDISGFKRWITDKEHRENHTITQEPYWEGKENGRSAESAISTLLVHLNRYAKTYSKSAIAGSDFATQEDFIYLINLKAFGAMNKAELIKKNVHDKSAGMLIISRLYKLGWIEQVISETDRRAKVIRITDKGNTALEEQMGKIRKATTIVAGDLTHAERLELITILTKLDQFHQSVFAKNSKCKNLLDIVMNEYLPKNDQ